MSVWHHAAFWVGAITMGVAIAVLSLGIVGVHQLWLRLRRRARPRRAARRQSLRGWWRDRYAVDFEPEWSDADRLAQQHGLPVTMFRTREFAVDDTVEQEPIR